MKDEIYGIPPHGGHFVQRVAAPAERDEFLDKAESLSRVQLDKRAVSDLEMIAIGGFSPLNGFMEQADYESVVDNMRLASGAPWSVPVTLSVSEDVAGTLKEGEWIRLDDPDGNYIGVLELTQKYRYNKAHEAVNVYRTDE
ncbi:MAG: sulfate adenylyltransferase, partial [Cyanobacteria bacterium P01_H01_bin.15]